MHRCRPAILALLCALLVPTAADAAKRPDLRAVGVTAPPAAQPGAVLPVRVDVAATGRARATKVRLYLSADRKRGKGDRRLQGAGAIDALRRAGRATVTVDATLPAKPANRYVVACADDPGKVRERNERNNCAASKRRIAIAARAADAEPRSSAALIEADRAAGRLSPAKALAYRVFALNGDPKLPARYAGEVVDDADHLALREAVSAFDRLPASVRRDLTPHLTRPDGAGAPAGRSKQARAAAAEQPCQTNEELGWRDVRAAGGKVAIWWQVKHPDGEARAKRLAPEITKAYASFKEVLGVEPPADDHLRCEKGDGALDLFLTTVYGGHGKTMPMKARDEAAAPPCGGRPSTIEIDREPVRFSQEFTATHELFHAFQNAFPYGDECRWYSWFDEGSANWAAHAVFPADNGEHAFTRGIEEPGWPMHLYDYDTWPFVLWLERSFGARSIGATYAGFARFLPARAVDAAIGGMREHVLDWARTAYNQAPLDPTLTGWDGFGAVPPVPEERPLALGGARKATVDAAVGLRFMERDYRRFAVTDDAVRRITYRNPAAGNPDLRVGALLTLAGGETRWEDWSGRAKVELCRDKPAEDVRNVLLVYANANLDARDGVNSGATESDAKVDVEASCDDFPWRYKVLGATHETSTDAFMPGEGQHYCGVAGGISIRDQETFKASVGESAHDPEDVVRRDADDGSLEGSVYVDAPAAWHDVLDGCRSTDDGEVHPCATTKDRTPTPDGTWSIGFHVRAPSAESGNATLTWTVLDPTGGFIDADNEVCNVDQIWKHLEDRHQQQEVPVATLAGTKPFTLTFRGGDTWDADEMGRPARIVASWSHTMTLQRVDPEGRPLE